MGGVIISSAQNMINRHEYVDLGLSVKWATCNVGATTPEKDGDYFAWGETSPKSSYTSQNSTTFGKDFGDISGNPNYDAARANWGGSWRIPTKAEQDELREKCDWTWTTRNGVNGYVVKSRVNGNSIFLPATGNGYGGDYWSSTPCGDYDAWRIYFSSYSPGTGSIMRYNGVPVRPVTD